MYRLWEVATLRHLSASYWLILSVGMWTESCSVCMSIDHESPPTVGQHVIQVYRPWPETIGWHLVGMSVDTRDRHLNHCVVINNRLCFSRLSLSRFAENGSCILAPSLNQQGMRKKSLYRPCSYVDRVGRQLKQPSFQIVSYLMQLEVYTSTE